MQRSARSEFALFPLTPSCAPADACRWAANREVYLLNGHLRRLLTTIAFALVLLPCVASASHARLEGTECTGIAGRVRDPAGAAWANVSVTAVSVRARTTYQATTDHNGEYRLCQLVPGKYELTFRADSLKTVRRSRLKVRQGRVTRADQTMVPPTKAVWIPK